MKKQLFLGALLLPGMFYAQTTPKLSVDENGIGKQFPDCMMSGSICNLFPTGKDASISAAYISKDSERAMTIGLKKNTLTEQRQIDIIGKKFTEIHPSDVLTFTMNAPFAVDRSLLTSLTMNPTYKVIPTGQYSVVITDEYVLIRFVLSDK